jgi:hypothetical protein
MASLFAPVTGGVAHQATNAACRASRQRRLQGNRQPPERRGFASYACADQEPRWLLHELVRTPALGAVRNASYVSPGTGSSTNAG